MADLESYLENDYVRGTLGDQRAWKAHLKNLLTTLRVPAERRRAASVAKANHGELALHIGCGGTYLEDWINVDLMSPGRRRDIIWDLRRGLPFPNSSAKQIFSEHLFEHIPLPGALNLLKECRRVLRQGGVIRVGVPDLERYVNAYFGNDTIIDDVRPDRATRAIAFSELFYFNGHCAAYDAETLVLLLTTAGFKDASKRSFGDSAIDPWPDSVHRRAETLYVEASV